MTDEYKNCKVIRAGKDDAEEVAFIDIKGGDTIFVEGLPYVTDEDGASHYSGDASYDGYLLYAEGIDFYPEDLDTFGAKEREQLLKVELVLENGDVIEIDPKHIEFISVSGITHEVRYGGGSIQRLQHAGEVLLRISKDADAPQCPFGINDDERKTSVFKRLASFGDVTQIWIYTNEKAEWFVTPFAEDSSSVNTAFHYGFTAGGDMVFALTESDMDELWGCALKTPEKAMALPF